MLQRKCLTFRLNAQVWVSVHGNRLLFSKDGGNTGAFSLFEATQKAQSVCFGYLDLRPGSEVKKQLISNRGSKGKTAHDNDHHTKKFQFLVRDGDAAVMFAAETEPLRDEWLEVIKQAIQGVNHFLPLSHLSLPAGAAAEAGPGEALVVGGVSGKRGSVVPAAVDFPNKAGYLKKTSAGKGTFAISTVTKRWFRLAAGELRYYEDEDESATKLKDCVSLEGAEAMPLQGMVVTVQFAGGRSMKLEAPTTKIATEWRDAFAETITILRNMPVSPKATTGLKPVRRLNVHDSDADRAAAVPEAPSTPGSAAASPAGGARRARAATATGLSATSPKRGGGDSSSDEDEGSPVPAGSFWVRLSISASSKSPTSSAGPSPSTKSRSQSTLSLTSGAAAASTVAEYRPKFLQTRGSNGHSTYKSTETVEMLKECLQQNFLLKRLPDVTPLIDMMEQHIAVPGEVIIWQGSSGDAFYALEAGQCDVLKDGRLVSRIPAGKSFGELALVNNAVRQATIRASQVCTLWSFTRNQYREVAMKQEARLVEERIAFLEGIELFSKLLRSSLEKIADVMVLRSYVTGDRIIKQGESGDAFYMIQQGRVAVTQTTTFGTSAGTELARLGPGKYFGELALIEDAPRKATVTATSACKCWTLDRQNFKSLFGSMAAAVNESVGIKMLQRVKVLEALSEVQLQAVARCLVSKDFIEGEVIIKQGDVGDCFYLISSGEVSVQVNHIQVATLEGGSFFGEMSLLSNERRSATVSALKDTVCLVLSRADFNELLGPLEEVNAEAKRRKEAASRSKGDVAGSGRFISSLRRVSNSIFNTSPSSSPGGQGLARSKSLGAGGKSANALFSSTNAMFDLASLEKVKKLGTGTFGTVFLVQHIMTNKYYAMKVLHKQHLKETCQEQNVFTERDVMLALGDTLYAAELYATLQDSKSVYLIQQFLPGGDLWELLHNSSRLKKTKEGGFSLNKALFYTSNALAAVSHMHQQEILYRNIKPENMVRVCLRCTLCSAPVH
jgi:CRP-like cAMP-binding protein